MSWDWEKTLGDVSQDISDVIKSQYALSYAKEAQPLVQQTFSSTVFPLIILILIGIVILKWKF